MSSRRAWWLCTAFAVLAMVSWQAWAQTAPVVAVAQGKLQGTLEADGKVWVYKGVPYAAPPTGDLRWRPPVAAKSWSGVRKGDQFGASCTQSKFEMLPFTREFQTPNETGEDCLFLNVWTPAKAGAKKLPVLVFIHGGAFSGGSGAIGIYSGENFAKLGLVAVTINYRLGALGFIATPELAKESNRGAAGNYGMLDQVAALQWVKKNIAAFGGDPANVTISGQSAGAASVGELISSPPARGLFQRAIVVSGPGFSRMHLPTLAEAEAAGTEFLKKHNAESLGEARKLSAESLLNAGFPSPFMPDADGWFLPANAQDLLAHGTGADVPVMIGSTSDESGEFLPFGKPAPYVEYAQKTYGGMAERYLKLYPANTEVEAAAAKRVAGRDRIRTMAYLWATARAKSAKSATFLYSFTRATPWPEHPEFGAFHTSDIPYAFGTLKAVNHPYEEADYKLSATLAQYWVNFARTGDPNGEGLPKWGAAAEDQKSVQELAVKIGPIPAADNVRFEFWKDYYASPVSGGASPL